MPRRLIRAAGLASVISLGVSVPFIAQLIGQVIAQQTSPAKSTRARGSRSAAIEYNNLGVAYMDRQEPQTALAEFDKAHARAPNLLEPRLNQAIALINLQQLARAQSILQELSRRYPQEPRVWYNLGLISKANGDTKKSARDFERVAKADPSDPESHYFLGQCDLLLRDYPAAIASFQLALQANPFHASAEFGLAQAYQRSGDVSQATQHFTRFQHLVEKKIGSPIGTAYGEQGKYSLAQEISPGLDSAPRAVPAHFEEVTSAAGLPTAVQGAAAGKDSALNQLGAGACAFDYDGDGRVDLFLADVGGRPALYRNIGNGKFENETAQSGIALPGPGLACTAGDYDHDGRPDLAITYDGGVALFHNEGNGKFSDATSSAGIRITGHALAVNFVDYDHDGDLDLLVTRVPDNGLATAASAGEGTLNSIWRNNGDRTFTEVTSETGLAGTDASWGTLASDINNDRAVDLLVTSFHQPPSIYYNQREGAFRKEQPWSVPFGVPAVGGVSFDFDKDSWMDLAFTLSGAPGLSLWRNQEGTRFSPVQLPRIDWTRGWGITTLDYDGDGFLDLVAVGEDSSGGHIVLLRNEGKGGFQDVSQQTGLSAIHLVRPRTIIAADFMGDGSPSLLITQNVGPPVLLRNTAARRNHWLSVQLKGLADNTSGIGTNVDVFAGTVRQKIEISAASGYLGQNGTAMSIGLSSATKAEVVRLLWPTGVVQDEIGIPVGSSQTIAEIDRRGSSCPILFAWNGREFQFIADVIGAGIVGHWLAPGERNVPNPTEYLKVNASDVQAQNGRVSFRLLEPEEELDYLDRVHLLAVDHPAGVEVNSNARFLMRPPYPGFQLIADATPHPPQGAWDEKGRDVLPLIAERDHKFVDTFPGAAFAGFAQPHWLELDMGQWDARQPLRLVLDGFTDYFSASSLYSAWQAGTAPIAPYVEELRPDGQWQRVLGNMGFPAGLERTMVVDLTGKVTPGTRRIRIVTNLKIYWDRVRIDIDNGAANASYRVRDVPLASARLQFRGFPRYVEGKTPGDLSYDYRQVSATGPYARQAGNYTRYGDVRSLLSTADEKYVVFGAGDEVAVSFDVSSLPPVPERWQRDYFFFADGFDKDMDFYADFGDTVSPLPFHSSQSYPYTDTSYPLDADHLQYLLQYNTRAVSGNPPPTYRFEYRKQAP